MVPMRDNDRQDDTEQRLHLGDMWDVELTGDWKKGERKEGANNFI